MSARLMASPKSKEIIMSLKHGHLSFMEGKGDQEEPLRSTCLKILVAVPV